MTRFSNSKVYKLINSVDSKIYVGSTTQPLSKRLMDHKYASIHKPRPVHRHFNKIGWDTVRIVLIETVTCINKEQLNQREQHWINLLKPSLNGRSAYVHCPHGRVHSVCKDCGGASICIHNKERPRCKECCGSQICSHNKYKQFCKICSPKYCQHCDITTSKNEYKRHKMGKKHIYNFIHY